MKLSLTFLNGVHDLPFFDALKSIIIFNPVCGDFGYLFTKLYFASAYLNMHCRKVGLVGRCPISYFWMHKVMKELPQSTELIVFQG